MKILVFGNIGSGKSYLINELIRLIPNFEILAIDDFRRKIGDGTMKKEIEAKSKFIDAIKENKNQIIEAMGFGETGEMIAEKIKDNKERKIIIMLTTPLEICIKHLDKRLWNIPYPSPVEKAYKLAAYTNELIQEKKINVIWNNAVNTSFFEFEILNNENLHKIKQTIMPNYIFKQHKIIRKLTSSFPDLQQIDGALLIGSFGRGDATFSSDIDISILTNEQFNIQSFQNFIKNVLAEHIKYIFYIEYRNKLTILFHTLPKLEISFFSNINDLDHLFIGSEISDLTNCILYDKSDNLLNHFSGTIENLKNEHFNFEKSFHLKVDKFLYDFENFSFMHRRSDAYKCYFLHNLALNDCFQLLQLKNQKSEYLYLPKNIKNYFQSSVEKEEFENLNGTLYLPEVNQKKRNLLNFFYKILDSQPYLNSDRITEIKEICEWIYKRDFGYNFRDISDNCSKLKKHLIYRTSTLTRYQKHDYFNELIDKFDIKTIIDIRADRELEKDSYIEEILAKINYVWAPFDPWNQSEEFKVKYCYGSNSEIAYRFFAVECKPSIKLISETILNQKEGSIAIHCHAGKDRTGCIIALFYLLVGASNSELYNDYFASETDTKEYKINSFLEIIRTYRSIEDYFISCGLSEKDVDELKVKLTA